MASKTSRRKRSAPTHPAPVVVTCDELAQSVTIDGITFYEVRALLNEGDDPEGRPALKDGDEGVETETEWSVAFRHEDVTLGVRVAMKTQTPLGSLVVDLAVNLRTPHPVEVSEEVAYEFINRVGLMMLYPYIRETASYLTGKVHGRALVMPVLRTGEIEFGKNVKGD